MSHLFLTGASGIGKSTLLTEILTESSLSVSGLFTQRLVLEDGTTTGFRLLPWTPGIPAISAWTSGLPDIFICNADCGWTRNLSVFATTGAALLDAAALESGIVCLDEIGGAELLVPEFRDRLYRLLSVHPRCIGVVKGGANLSSMLDTLKLPAPEVQALIEFRQDLLSHFRSRILCMTATNRKQIAEVIRSYLYRGDFDGI